MHAASKFAQGELARAGRLVGESISLRENQHLRYDHPPAHVELRRLPAEGEDDPEGGALAGVAQDADRAAHEGREFLADRQPETRAAVGAGDGAVDLAEL